MRTSVFFLLLLLQAAGAASQEAYVSEDIDTKHITDLRTESYYIPGKEEYAIFVRMDKVLCTLLLKDNKVQQKLLFKGEWPLPAEYAGNVSYGKKYSIFCLSSKEVSSITVDFATSRISSHQFDIDWKKETIVEALSGNDRFYLISLKKNSSELSVLRFDSDTSYVKKTISLKEYPNLYAVFSRSPLKKVISDGINKLQNTYSTNKVYSRGDTLVFTIDTLNRTDIILLDTRTGEYSLRKEHFKPAGYRQTNSFLLGELLFQAGCSEKEIRVQVRNLNTREEKNLVFDQDYFDGKEKITSRENDFISYEKQKPIQDGKKFLGRILKNRLGLAADRQGDTLLELTLGEYSGENTSFMEKYNPAGNAQMPLLLGGAPGAQIPSSYALYDYNILFKGISYTNLYISTGAFREVPGESTLEKVLFFEDKLSVRNICRLVFKRDNRFYYSYLDLREKQLRIFKL